MARLMRKSAATLGILCCILIHLYLSDKTWHQLQRSLPSGFASRFMSMKEEPSKPANITNPHNFSYPINIDDICRKENVVVIMPVSTAVYNFDKRRTFRKSTQAKYAANKKNGLKILYFVGTPSKKVPNMTEYHEKLMNESSTYGDIIQIRLEDTYKNLIYKSLAIMYWIANYCYTSSFVLRADDDIEINATAAILALNQNRKFFKNFMIGHRRTRARPVRDKSHKYYMSEEEFPMKYFPPHLAGPSMGYPTTTSHLLYQKAIKTKCFWIEDVFYSGIVRSSLDIPAIHDVNFKTSLIHRSEMPGEYFVYS